MKAEQVRPYNATTDKTEQVRQMFDNIAPTYDRLNRIISLGLDKSWRRKAIRLIAEQQPKKIIDIASGTGDFAILQAQSMPDVIVHGLDLSADMTLIAQRKSIALGLNERMAFCVGDCLADELPPNSADVVSVAFGVRNFADLHAGYTSMHRLLRHGGMLCVVELTQPTNRLVYPFYKLYTKGFIPLVGALISHDNRAYKYLPESIAAMPQGEKMLELMQQCGFSNTRFTPLSFGVCTIYTGFKYD